MVQVAADGRRGRQAGRPEQVVGDVTKPRLVLMLILPDRLVGIFGAGSWTKEGEQHWQEYQSVQNAEKDDEENHLEESDEEVRGCKCETEDA